jgi:hypothetical protein
MLGASAPSDLEVVFPRGRPDSPQVYKLICSPCVGVLAYVDTQQYSIQSVAFGSEQSGLNRTSEAAF